jgi:hypothetical protein
VRFFDPTFALGGTTAGIRLEGDPGMDRGALDDAKREGPIELVLGHLDDGSHLLA